MINQVQIGGLVFEKPNKDSKSSQVLLLFVPTCVISFV